MSKELNEKRKASLKVSEAMGLISPLLHVGQFKTDAAKVVDEYHLDVTQVMSNSLKDIAEDLDTNVETAEELMDVCSTTNLMNLLDNAKFSSGDAEIKSISKVSRVYRQASSGPDRLHCLREEEIEEWDDITKAPLNTGLETVKQWIKVNKGRTMDKKPNFLKSKYTEYDCSVENDLIAKPAKSEDDAVQVLETILTVAVNFPRSVRKHKHTTINYRVLGSQRLTELRDIIPCALDEQPIGQFTDNPDHPRDIKCKHLFKAGYFFIENTFYHDHRFESTGHDLSKVVFEWAKANDLTVPSDIKEVNMEAYTFDDLDLCLGSPYLYMHQGDCEHIIILKDIRLLHPDDCMSRCMYPLAVSRAKFKSSICKVCNHLIGTWLTRNDEFSDEDPSFFCDTCFRMLHYNKDGTRAGEFVALPFVNRGEIMF